MEFSETPSCYAEMNEARAAGGLVEFKEAIAETQVLPKHAGTGRTTTPADLLEQICKNVVGVSVTGTLPS